tara:strand:+ start:423 stop:686 length:264 start_codon:yes stop_codon:yes gene_type:complete
MISKKQKKHKIKLIYLIIIVNTEYAKRKPFKNMWETIEFAYEQVWWAMELKKVATQKTFEKGVLDGLATVGENTKSEIIIPKAKNYE